ncbi:MAG: Kelch repeat-containing protein [Fimbriimonadaceae bacterium]
MSPTPFSYANASWLLTDGSVLIMTLDGTGTCFKLTPDNTGSYINGTWSQAATMITQRLYFGSGVLADGRVLVCGGEYSGSNFAQTETNACEIYDAVANTWTSVPAPSGWGNIGDSPTMVLPNGQFLIGHNSNSQSALYDPTTSSWTFTGNSNAGLFAEDTWTLLPNNRVLDIECFNSPFTQYYDVASGTWVSIPGSLPGGLADPGPSHEIGADVLLPNDTVFAIGGTANTDIYDVASNTWSGGPTLPIVGGSQLCQSDAPAAVLPDGNVLMALSPYSPNNYPGPTYMFEYDGTSIAQVADAPIDPNIPSFAATFLVLPTGQVLMTSQSNEVDIYTPAGSPQAAWAPTITSAASAVQQGSSNNPLSGTQLNGVSQGAAYGDDNASFTNYPIVRIQNAASGHVFYCRTHDHSTMGVQTGSAIVSTQFDVPAGTETGPSRLYVVANGIPSAPQTVNVVAPHVVLPSTYSLFRGIQSSGGLSSLFFADSNVVGVQTGPTLVSSEAPVQVVVTGTSPTLSPTSLKFTTTAKLNTPGTSQTISLWNYSTGKYDVLDTREISTSSLSVTVTATGTLSNYVGLLGAVQAKISYKQTGPTLIYHWTASIDLANWTIQ